MRAKEPTTPGVRRIALVVGDTRGHFYPALAVAEAYRRRAADVDVVFFGAAGVSAELAARHLCSYRVIRGSPLARVGVAGRLASLVRTAAGVGQARRALIELDVRLAIGFGAFVSGAVLVAARTIGIPTAIHEANTRPGLANRLLARVADRAYVAAADVAPQLRAAHVRVTGWPVRRDIAALVDVPRRPPDGSRPTRVLVCSGSRGGEFLGRRMPALCQQLATHGLTLDVHHQSEDDDPEPIRRAYALAGVQARVAPVIEDMAAAYGWADLAIARAGAGTTAELAVAGLPSLLVPLADAAEDHQAGNAAAFAAAGSALWRHERGWDTSTLAEQLHELLTAPAAWSSMSAAARRCAVPGAADAVVDDCEQLLGAYA
jgi:UDP-N-acetylglucosamine--N-acetylmuramyl-(pentapeptide) pyrophosphoryl-undecaprenol N-acetylglucosamine transferase